MTRLLNALKADIIFQYKQGFYLIYIIITLMYLLVLSQLNITLVKYILPVLVYIDPSILGLFFIGGILLLEKEQGILSLVYVTPLKTLEYMVSKLVSLCIISLIASLSLSLFAYSGKVNYLLLIIGISLSSLIYTLFGFSIASKSKSVNDFFVKMIPLMITFILPCILMFVFPNFYWLNIFPSVSALKLVWGSYHGISMIESIYCITYSLFITYVFYKQAYSSFQTRMLVTD